MTRSRVAAAAAAVLTALLLQAVLIGPLTLPVPVSLPAVLVAAVALQDGPATGMSFGFAAGLIADLGSRHPAGVLALCWLGLGLVAGMGGARRSVRGDAAVAAITAGLSATAATVLLVVLHADGATLLEAVRGVIPASLADAVLALAVVPVVRRALRTDSLRAAQPVYTDFVLAGRRG